ncbi:RNA-binding domain-containing protein [Adlercreutzia sp. ZJ304]|uniref:RNA-binding domain-containing protein n=1 Tax=Adlercreutzia sp. ZJ304 TaxID=2709791 RepID=UPI0013EA5882|nr:RNA-binding domain-containing protein [Adlercreutzia sp. ZJ304]
MSPSEFESQLAQGEGQTIEFKRCSTFPHADTFETVCSFANRIGGNIYLGVENDGSIRGVDPLSILDIERNIVNVTGNPAVFTPSPALEFEKIEYNNKLVIRIWVPMGPSVYRYKNVIYDRIADVDAKVTNDDQISLMYIRKKSYYSEQKVFPYIEFSDLRPDLIDRARSMAATNRRDHPWTNLDDKQLLHAAGLYTHDRERGLSGYTLAAALLLGTDELIRSVCPAYLTDAIVRIENKDRYDDRLMVRTNLMEAYAQLSSFCRRHLPDRFLLENDQRVSARDVIVRELISNVLIHREFLSAVPAQVTIDEQGIHTRNASKSVFNGQITLADFSPRPKNPLIADFFTQVGLAEEMGSGTRNLYKYSLAYTGTEPILIDGDMFKADIATSTAPRAVIEKTQDIVLRTLDELLKETDSATAVQIAERANISLRSTQRHLSNLIKSEEVEALGSTNSRAYRRARRCE